MEKQKLDQERFKRKLRQQFQKKNSKSAASIADESFAKVQETPVNQIKKEESQKLEDKQLEFEKRDFKQMQAERNKIFDRMTSELIQRHRNVSIKSGMNSNESSQSRGSAERL